MDNREIKKDHTVIHKETFPKLPFPSTLMKVKSESDTRGFWDWQE